MFKYLAVSAHLPWDIVMPWDIVIDYDFKIQGKISKTDILILSQASRFTGFTKLSTLEHNADQSILEFLNPPSILASIIWSRV